MERDYGTCECGGSLQPVWFKEEETIFTRDGYMHKTGRVREAVSHLVCDCCLRNDCVDDSFDLPWRNK